MTPFASYLDPRALLGLAFVAALAFAALKTARRLPAVSFGLLWFLLALLPTALMPLAEVANDHRMFMAFPGLALAVCALSQKALDPRIAASRAWKQAVAVVGCIVLAAAAVGTYERNEVWRSEETLWRDVTIKSPRNGRGLMNYGLSLMARGDYGGALEYFDRAVEFVPFYPLLQINRAIALSALGRSAQAEANFRNAIGLNPQQATGYYQYGRWLWQAGRRDEAARNLETALRLNPQDFQAAALRMEVLTSLQRWQELQDLVENTLRLAPAEPSALRYRQLLPAAQTGPPRTAEQFLDLSLAHYRAGRYMESIGAAKKALELRPDYAEAYNNIAAGYNAQHMWDEGIRAASEAVRLRPDWDLARNNLLHAQRSKAEGK
jgi:tetratricopeptide (TPR) repeat protein